MCNLKFSNRLRHALYCNIIPAEHVSPVPTLVPMPMTLPPIPFFVNPYNLVST